MKRSSILRLVMALALLLAVNENVVADNLRLGGSIVGKIESNGDVRINGSIVGRRAISWASAPLCRARFWLCCQL